MGGQTTRTTKLMLLLVVVVSKHQGLGRLLLLLLSWAPMSLA